MRRLKFGKLGSKSINEVLDTVLPTFGTAPTNWVASQGTLTIAEPVTADDTMTIGTTVYTFKASTTGVKAQGTLTIAEPVTADDTMTIGTTVYTFKTGATAAAGQIGLGGNEAATKLAIVAAINGTDTFNAAHPLVSAAAFSGDACVITARATGTAGNAIATTETFTHVSNVFDAATLGTTTAGVVATVGAAGQIGLGENEATTKLNIVSAINGGDEFANNVAHPQVTAAAWASGDTCALTARVKGTAGDLIATTETFTHASNIFDDTTLGTTTAGVDATPGVVGEMLYDETNLYFCTAKNETWRKVAHSAL